MEMERTVLLVDADVAKPSVPPVLGIKVETGLMDVLFQDGADLSDVFALASDVASGQRSFPPNSPDFNQDGAVDLTDVFDLANVVAGASCP